MPIGGSGLRQRRSTVGSYFGCGSGAGGFNVAEPRLLPARARRSRAENCIISVMEKARSGRLFVSRFDARLRVRLFDLLFAIGLTQRTHQLAVI